MATNEPSANLRAILGEGHQNLKIGLSEERVRPLIPVLRQYISFWREYPDMFVDFLQTGGDPTRERPLKFYFYQRVFLRVVMRYRYVYAVFPRGYSKSFLSVMMLMIKCVLFPRSKLFVTSGGKEQSAAIIKEKVNDICTLVPAFNREIERSRSGTVVIKTQESRDSVQYAFTNGSYFNNVAATERSRGMRKNGGVMEECVGIDGEILSQVIIPMMNVDRLCMNGERDPDEIVNKAQTFITTAGYKGTFSYLKLIQYLVWMITAPDKAFIMGGSWRTPVVAGLQSLEYVTDLKKDDTYNELAFDREYESRWSGTSDRGFFDGVNFDKNRVLQKAEYQVNRRGAGDNVYYIISVDVGRNRCPTVITVIKCVPQAVGTALKNIVNIYTLENTHFEEQAIFIKKLFFQYNARRVVLDGNGLGIGLLDVMVKSQDDETHDEHYPDFGVYKIIANNCENHEKDVADYRKYATAETVNDALYVIKAGAQLNTIAHGNCQAQLNSSRLKFLIDEQTARGKLLETTMGQKMTPEQRAEYLKPYTLTSILKDEMLNLQEKNEGINIILTPSNTNIRTDKFSSLEYGLFYIRQEEENAKKKKKRNFKEWRFFSST